MIKLNYQWLEYNKYLWTHFKLLCFNRSIFFSVKSVFSIGFYPYYIAITLLLYSDRRFMVWYARGSGEGLDANVWNQFLRPLNGARFSILIIHMAEVARFGCHVTIETSVMREIVTIELKTIVSYISFRDSHLCRWLCKSSIQDGANYLQI